MNEKKFWEYIDFLNTQGSRPGLDGIRELCKRLGNPQDRLTFIHVAGTNGKGSTTAFLASVLMQGGYRVGRYNSPAVREYRERILVGRQKITKEALFRLMGQVCEACREMERDGYLHPTAFEAETALGFLYFVEKKCDIVILEAGMGGALDATNLIPVPLVAVLTSISMDHRSFLGETLSQIAEQKAGIIKQGGTVVTTHQPDEVMEVLCRVCAEQRAKLCIAGEPEDTSRAVDRVRSGIKKQSFRYGGRLQIELSLAGKFQIENAVLAMRVIEVLREAGYPLTDAMIVRGFRLAEWQGRFSVLSEKPYFIVDGAHNADGAKKLAQTIRFYFTNKRIIYIMGILKDKDHEAIIRETAPLAGSIITVKTPDLARATDAFVLAQEVMPYCSQVTAAGSVEEAVEMAYLLAGRDDVIIAFGSLSYLGRVMDIMEKKKSGRSRKK